ncbi:MAG: hypothetical protein ACLRT5_20215 [Lachnospiraceae bacterium]
MKNLTLEHITVAACHGTYFGLGTERRVSALTAVSPPTVGKYDQGRLFVPIVSATGQTAINLSGR